jgi:hypothetical protein
MQHLEGLEALLGLGIWGVLILIVLAICTVVTAVWLWRKI